MNRVLVTGATGFLGQRCLPLLRDAGFEVHAVTSRAAVPADARVHWHHADLLDERAIPPLLEEANASHLLHCAWIATPGVFWTSRENERWLQASRLLFEEFFLRGGGRAVGVGSCAEYQWQQEDCVEESTPLQPDTLYGQCKLQAAIELSAAAREGSVAWARIFFPYGPGEAGERLIPSVICGLLQGRPVECTHGLQVRDYIYIDDAAAALVSLLRGDARGAFNVGSGTGLSLRSVVSAITAQLGHAELVQFGARPAPPGEPPRVVADTRRLRRLTDWKPRVGIEDGVARSIEAWRRRLGS